MMSFSEFPPSSSQPSSRRPRSGWGRGRALLALLASVCLAGPAAWADPPPTPTPTIAIDFSGLWRADTPATSLFFADDFAELSGHIAALEPQGWRIEAFESWEDQGQRRFAGLFRPGSGVREIFLDLDAAAFEARRKLQFSAGRRLVDVEVQMVGGQRRYSGLWRPGLGSEIVIDNLSAADFEAQVLTYAGSYKLTAFETWRVAGEVFAYGVLRGSASTDSAVVIGRSWAQFAADLLTNDYLGKRLVDLDIAAEPDSDHLFSGRFETRTWEFNWLGALYLRSWLTAANSLLTQGYGFSGLDVPENYVLGSPAATPMQLRDLEVALDIRINTIITQAKPLNDSGIPAAPRLPPP